MIKQNTGKIWIGKQKFDIEYRGLCGDGYLKPQGKKVS
jgi:hypothetical protein